MNIIRTSPEQRRAVAHVSNYQTARIAELAAGRLHDPHAAQVAELIGCSFEHAQKYEFHRRLAILRDLYSHLICEQWRGKIGSWLHSPARLIALQEAIREELVRLDATPQTEAECIFAQGYVPQIEAAVRTG